MERTRLLHYLCSSWPRIQNAASEPQVSHTTAKWVDPALAGCLSFKDAELLSDFLQTALIDHANFFAIVLGGG